MRAEQRAHAQEETISMLQLVRSQTLRRPLLIAIVMQLSQQLSGINAVSKHIDEEERAVSLNRIQPD